MSFGNIQASRQDLDMSQSAVQRWRSDPMGQLPESHLITNVYASRGTGVSTDMNSPWNDIRRRIITSGPGESTIIAILGPSGQGKTMISGGVLKALKEDAYLLTESRTRGSEPIPIFVPFALAAKTAQIPADQGGPGIVSPDADHGRFSESEYAEISSFQERVLRESLKRKDPRIKKVYIVEASGAPFITQRPVRGKELVLSGMKDRGNSALYNLAYDPEIGPNMFVLMICPDDYANTVGDIAKSNRINLDPNTPDIEAGFRGNNRYLLTDKKGVEKTVDEIVEEDSSKKGLYREVARLMRMVAAPPKAMENGWSEYTSMLDMLTAQGEIPKSSSHEYFNTLRRKLIPGIVGAAGIPGKQVHILTNRPRREFNDYDLDAFLRWNIFTRMHQGALLKDMPLLSEYMELPEDEVLTSRGVANL